MKRPLAIAQLIDDPDMFPAAKLLIDPDGKDAAFVAARREAELAADGDIEGVVAWRAIRRTIEEL